MSTYLLQIKLSTEIMIVLHIYTRLNRSISILLFSLWATNAQTQGIQNTTQLHPWQVPTPRFVAEAYFPNLKDGDQIETPYLLKFGLTGGWGLAPISEPARARSGHHHLLVNRDLPLDFKKALPFNDQYIHFGKGQMETVLTLEPGKYTLRLLLADQQHLPHFVFSESIRITVTGKNGSDPKALSKKNLSLGLEDGVQKRPFRVRFHASALDVGHKSQGIPNTGHFRLTMLPEGVRGSPAVFSFIQGQTEVWLSPPKGIYSLQLDLIDNADMSKILVDPVRTLIEVQ